MRAQGEALGAKQQLVCDVCDTVSWRGWWIVLAAVQAAGAGVAECVGVTHCCREFSALFCLGLCAGVLASLRVWKPVLIWTRTCSKKSSSVKVLLFSVWNCSDNGTDKCWDSSGVCSEVMCLSMSQQQVNLVLLPVQGQVNLVCSKKNCSLGTLSSSNCTLEQGFGLGWSLWLTATQK